MLFGIGRPDVQSLKRNKDIEGLIKAINYRWDKEIQKTAAKCLGELGDKRAIEQV